MKLQITAIKSLNKITPNQKKTAIALGLHKKGQTVVKEDNDCIKGMISVIAHLVNVVEIK